MVGGGDAHAGVLDLGERDFAVPARPHGDAPSARREFQCVRDQIVEKLSEPASVPDEHRELSEGQDELDLRVCRVCPRSLGALHSEVAEIDGAEFERERARVDLTDEEEILDEPKQPPRVSVDHCHQPVLLLGHRPALALLQQLEVAAHRRQRRAKLVRDNGDERVA